MSEALPRNVEAERSVLGSLLVSEPALGRVIEGVGLQPEDFYEDRNKHFYAAILAVNESGKPCDELTVPDALETSRTIDKAGGPGYASELAANVPDPGNVEHYAEMVKQGSNRRRIIKAAQKTISVATSGDLNGEVNHLIDALGHAENPGIATAKTRSSWKPKDLGPVLDRLEAGESLTEEPDNTLLATDQGRGILYPETIVSIAGPGGIGKGKLAGRIVGDVIASGGHAIYIDLEENEARRVATLYSLGVGPAHIRNGLDYLSPETKIGDMARLGELIRPNTRVVVFDSVNPAMSLEGFSLMDNEDVVSWYQMVPKFIQRQGVMALLVDHQTKAGDSKTAIGGIQKFNQVDHQLILESVDPLGRGKIGRVKIHTAKDRLGFFGLGHHHDMIARSTGDTLDITIADLMRTEGDFRPTARMEKVSILIEDHPGIGVEELRNKSGGRASITDDARRYLVSDGYVDERKAGRKLALYSLDKYRDNGGTSSSTRPGDRDRFGEVEDA